MSLTTRQAKLDGEWARVETFAAVLVDAFDLGWCQITLVRSDSGKDGDERCVADTVAEWQYRHASVTFYLPSTLVLSDDELEDVIAHELVHVMHNSMESLCKDDSKSTAMRELATENVTRALMTALRLSR